MNRLYQNVSDGPDHSVVSVCFDESGVLISVTDKTGKRNLLLSLEEVAAMYEILSDARPDRILVPTS